MLTFRNVGNHPLGMLDLASPEGIEDCFDVILKTRCTQGPAPAVTTIQSSWTIWADPNASIVAAGPLDTTVLRQNYALL